MNTWNKQMIDSGWVMKMITDHEAKGKRFTCFQDLDSSLPSYPAIVPGCAELDLASVNVLPDPYYGLNVLEVQKLEAYHFFYSTQFEYHAVPNHLLTLVFEGLDTVCDLYVNGEFIGHTDNMLIEHSFPLHFTGHGTAELFIHIYPACIAARGKELSQGTIRIVRVITNRCACGRRRICSVGILRPGSCRRESGNRYT